MEQKSEIYVEKGLPTAKPSSLAPGAATGFVDEILVPHNRFQRWALRLEATLGFEARGIERVPEELREGKTSNREYVQMCLIWFSANITANNTMIGLLGPSVFHLGLKDAMVIASFGAMMGAICSGYISTFGPISGNRTLV
jgi:cytochrome c biogenesis protein ResB